MELKRRYGGLISRIGFIIFIFILLYFAFANYEYLHIQWMGKHDKLVHIISMSLIVPWLYFAFKRYGSMVIMWMLVLLVTGCIAVEFLQPILTHGLRQSDYKDLEANGIGFLIGSLPLLLFPSGLRKERGKKTEKIYQ